MNKKALASFLENLEETSSEIFQEEIHNPDEKIDLLSESKVNHKIIEKLFKEESFEKIKNEDDEYEKFYINHRERVKERFLNGDTASFLDYDLMEMVLFFIIPRRDVKQLAKNMTDHFGNIRNIVQADENDLKKFLNNPKNIKFFFKLISEICLRVPRTRLKSENALSNWETLIEYLEKKIGHLSHEEFHILCLDMQYRLIDDIKITSGTIDEITIYIRDIIKKILSISTKYIIVSHNHPSGKSDPSAEDMNITENINKAMGYIDVVLLDHIIIAKDSDKHFSFKANFLI